MRGAEGASGPSSVPKKNSMNYYIAKRQKTVQLVARPVYNIYLPNNAFTRDAVPVWLAIGLVTLLIVAPHVNK